MPRIGTSAEHRITHQRDRRQDVHRAAHADQREKARDGERLEQEAQQVDAREEVAVEGPDELLLRRDVAGVKRMRLVAHQVSEHEFSRRVHDVEQHRQGRDQDQVAAAKDQGEPVARGQFLLGVAGHFRNGVARRDAIDRDDDGAANDQNRSGQQLKLIRRGLQHRDQPLRPQGSQPCSQAAADADHREEPLALRFRVDVVGEGPDLADDEDVEDADPDVEHHAFLRAADAGQVEDHQVGDEEQQQARNQLDADHLGADVAVQRNQEHQQRRLPGAGIGFHVRAAFGQDQRLTHRLEQVIGEQQQEDVDGQQQRAPALARPRTSAT